MVRRIAGKIDRDLNREAVNCKDSKTVSKAGQLNPRKASARRGLNSSDEEDI